MRTGLCPKCGSGNVFKKENGIQLGEHMQGLMIRTGVIVTPSLYESYVCRDCGYFENYILDQKKLSDIAQKWEAVMP